MISRLIPLTLPLTLTLALALGLGACVRASTSGAPCEADEDCAASLVCAISPGQEAGICRQDGHGRLGSACDTTTGDPCRYLCLVLDDGQGVCTEPCGDGLGACPAGYQCGPVANPRPGDPFVCQPTAGCGALDYQGQCQGSVLSYCADTGPVVFDCASLTGDDGRPLQCALVNGQHGHDCVSSDFGEGCGEIPLEGLCQDNVVFYCASLETGAVQQLVCEDGEECAVDEDGVARCRPTGTAGCGNVTYTGYCDGDTAVWCEDAQLQYNECGDGQRCGFVDNETGYWCINGGPTGAHTARGAFRFQRPVLTAAGLGANMILPVRQALVQVRRQRDNQVLASDYTRQDGSFELGFDGDEPVYVIAWTTQNTARYQLTVRDCPLQNCGGDGNVYAANTEPFTGARDLGDLTIPADGVAGAFNIFEVMVRGTDLAQQRYGGTPPAVTAQWARGSNTFCGTSCYSPRNNTLFILGTRQDTDEFDDPVLGHEFGHFVEAAFSRSDSPGGAHDGSPTDPRLAWGEGYGTFIGSTIFGSPVYIDTFGSGQSVIDISQINWTADPNAPRGQEQPLSEFVVAQALWRIASGGGGASPQGDVPIFDVLGRYLPSSRMADRGVRGVDLVDFLDGWFCRGHGARQAIQTNLTDTHGFPYDYDGPADCR